MLTKSQIVQEVLLQEIAEGKYLPESPIPSRNHLARRFNCSRSVIEQAAAALTRAGFLTARKGSGTYVSRERKDFPIRKLFLVSRRQDENSFFAAQAKEAYPFLEINWIPGAMTGACLETLSAPGSAVIWQLPGYEQLNVMNYLKCRKIPQLLLNRDFGEFDSIRTDQLAGIREGLAWLLRESGGEFAIIGRTPSVSRPYQAERVLAAFQAVLESGFHCSGSNCILDPFVNLQEKVEEIAANFASRVKIPRGIFLLNVELAVPFLMAAGNRGLHPGREYKLLLFDYTQALKESGGIGMMRQDYAAFQRETLHWMEFRMKNSTGLFSSAVKPEFIVNT